MIFEPLYVLGMLCLSIIISEWLVRKTFLKHLSTALLVILAVAVSANVGLIPSASQGSVIYTGVFRYIAPLSIFFLLLDVNLESIRKAGAPMLLLFAAGMIGTVLGVIAGMHLIDGQEHFGDFYPAVTGMFVGTYTGGSVNFNALALHYNIMEEGVLYAGMTAVDNIMTAIWMVVTLAIPNLLNRKLNRITALNTTHSQPTTNPENDTESIGIMSFTILITMGIFSLWISNLGAVWFASLGLEVPSILILTTIALVLAQIPAIHKMAGGHLLGLFCVYLFLAVIGAYCEIAAMGQIGDLAWMLLVLVLVTVIVHGLLVYGVAAIGKIEWELASVASQANIGGSSTALALAKSLNRMDLYLPGILIGALGNGVGTYLGFIIARWFS